MRLPPQTAPALLGKRWDMWELISKNIHKRDAEPEVDAEPKADAEPEPDAEPQPEPTDLHKRQWDMWWLISKNIHKKVMRDDWDWSWTHWDFLSHNPSAKVKRDEYDSWSVWDWLSHNPSSRKVKRGGDDGEDYDISGIHAKGVPSKRDDDNYDLIPFLVRGGHG